MADYLHLWDRAAEFVNDDAKSKFGLATLRHSARLHCDALPFSAAYSTDHSIKN